MTGNAVLENGETSTAGRMVSTGLLALAMASLLLAVNAGDSDAKGLKFNLSPKKDVPVGKRTCFKGEVRGKAGNPVEGAVINLEGKAIKSKKRGKVGFCTVVRWPGKHSALAQKGKKTGYAHFNAKSSGVGVAGGVWVHQEMQLAAYRETGDSLAGCNVVDSSSMPDFATDSGECRATANPGTDGIFSGERSKVAWEATPVGQRVSLRLKASVPAVRYLDGYMTSEAARILYISSGRLDDPGGLVETGITPSLAGQKGGPMLLNITLHRNYTSAPDGYTFHAAGWVAKFDPK